MVYLQLIAGLLILIAGAEVLVRGASKIAGALRISSLVIGLTVVAFGTSSPELAVSIMSSLQGQGDIALGNVVGSNIFNVLFILGLAALISPLVVARQLIRLDVPIMLGASLVALAFAWDGRIAAWEGGLLVVLGVAYTTFLIRQSRREQPLPTTDAADHDAPPPRLWLSALLVLAGLGLLILGSNWLVDSAVSIARDLGISDLVVGLTIIAAGTSLPEVATSVIATLRGERDIAVGNVVGSNIFNLLFILGIAAGISGGIPVAETALRFDIPVMIAVALACLPLFFTGSRVDRWEGLVFLGYYVAYTVYVVMASQQSASLAAFSRTMLWFTLPLTALTILILASREWHRKRRAKPMG